MNYKLKFFLKNIIPANFNRVDWVQRSLMSEMERNSELNTMIIAYLKKQDSKIDDLNRKIQEFSSDEIEYLTGIQYGLSFGFKDTNNRIKSFRKDINANMISLELFNDVFRLYQSLICFIHYLNVNNLSKYIYSLNLKYDIPYSQFIKVNNKDELNLLIKQLEEDANTMIDRCASMKDVKEYRLFCENARNIITNTNN